MKILRLIAREISYVFMYPETWAIVGTGAAIFVSFGLFHGWTKQ